MIEQRAQVGIATLPTIAESRASFIQEEQTAITLAVPEIQRNAASPSAKRRLMSISAISASSPRIAENGGPDQRATNNGLLARFNRQTTVRKFILTSLLASTASGLGFAFGVGMRQIKPNNSTNFGRGNELQRGYAHLAFACSAKLMPDSSRLTSVVISNGSEHLKRTPTQLCENNDSTSLATFTGAVAADRVDQRFLLTQIGSLLVSVQNSDFEPAIAKAMLAAIDQLAQASRQDADPETNSKLLETSRAAANTMVDTLTPAKLLASLVDQLVHSPQTQVADDCGQTALSKTTQDLNTTWTSEQSNYVIIPGTITTDDIDPQLFEANVPEENVLETNASRESDSATANAPSPTETSSDTNTTTNADKDQIIAGTETTDFIAPVKSAASPSPNNTEPSLAPQLPRPSDIAHKADALLLQLAQSNQSTKLDLHRQSVELLLSAKAFLSADQLQAIAGSAQQFQALSTSVSIAKMLALVVGSEENEPTYVASLIQGNSLDPRSNPWFELTQASCKSLSRPSSTHAGRATLGMIEQKAIPDYALMTAIQGLQAGTPDFSQAVITNLLDWSKFSPETDPQATKLAQAISREGLLGVFYPEQALSGDPKAADNVVPELRRELQARFGSHIGDTSAQLRTAKQIQKLVPLMIVDKLMQTSSRKLIKLMPPAMTQHIKHDLAELTKLYQVLGNTQRLNWLNNVSAAFCAGTSGQIELASQMYAKQCVITRQSSALTKVQLPHQGTFIVKGHNINAPKIAAAIANLFDNSASLRQAYFELSAATQVNEQIIELTEKPTRYEDVSGQSLVKQTAGEYDAVLPKLDWIQSWLAPPKNTTFEIAQALTLTLKPSESHFAINSYVVPSMDKSNSNKQMFVDPAFMALSQQILREAKLDQLLPDQKQLPVLLTNCEFIAAYDNVIQLMSQELDQNDIDGAIAIYNSIDKDLFVAVESRDNADTAAIADTAATTSASDDARRALSQYKLDLVPLQPSRADVSAREVALQTLLLASQAKPESSPANHAIITQRNLQQLAPMLTKIAGQSEWDAAIVQNAQAITRTQA